MILNVSARTDIVSFYSKWFMNRYEKGYVDIRNPFYPKNISRIYFKDLYAIVFYQESNSIMKYIKKLTNQ